MSDAMRKLPRKWRDESLNGSNRYANELDAAIAKLKLEIERGEDAK